MTLPTERILLVEDNPKTRLIAQRTLVSFGYSVTPAVNAATALVLIDSDEAFDLLFTDIRMAGEMNGLDLARVVVLRRPAIRVLITSGYSEVTNEELVNLRATFIAKPYRMVQLEKVLRQVFTGLKAP